MAGTRIVLTLRPDVAEALKAEAEAVGVGVATLAAVILGQHLASAKAVMDGVGASLVGLAREQMDKEGSSDAS